MALTRNSSITNGNVVRIHSSMNKKHIDWDNQNTIAFYSLGKHKPIEQSLHREIKRNDLFKQSFHHWSKPKKEVSDSRIVQQQRSIRIDWYIKLTLIGSLVAKSSSRRSSRQIQLHLVVQREWVESMRCQWNPNN